MSEFITYDENLYKLLGMNINKSYRVNDVKKVLNKKRLHLGDLQKYFPTIKFCSCGKCSVNQDRLLEYVEKNLIYKPINISHYEYMQQPVEIKHMEFE